MQTKLTLSLESLTIEKAKDYARKHGKSVSELVESYFRSLTGQNSTDSQNISTPITDSLAGSLKNIKLSDLKAERSEYLENKYINK
jgi:hypothetical protein